MKPTLSNLALLAAAGTLLSGTAFAADAVVLAKAAKPAAQERGAESQAPRLKPVARAEVAHKDAKADGAGKPRQTEVPVSVVLSAD
jgi:hypothetical protein